MTFIIGASAHGSPGVSTALQLVAAQWPEPPRVPVVVEADRSGGVFAAQYSLSLTPGMVTLAESLRKFESPELLDHAQRLPSGVACVPLSPSATAAATQLRSAGGFLGPYLAATGHPVLLDAGLIVPDSQIIAELASADLLLWFVRPTREELLVLRHRLVETPQPDAVGIVLVGDAPYDADQVEAALGMPVVHVMPIDERAAAAAAAGGDDRYLRRSSLARSSARLAEELRDRFPGRPASSTAPPPGSPASPDRVAAGAGTAPMSQATVRSAVAPAPAPAEGDDIVLWLPDAGLATEPPAVMSAPSGAPSPLADLEPAIALAPPPPPQRAARVPTHHTLPSRPATMWGDFESKSADDSGDGAEETDENEEPLVVWFPERTDEAAAGDR